MTPADKPGSDGLPNAWLFNELTSLREEMRERLTRHGTEMRGGFEGINARMDKLDDHREELARRVTIIETERRLEGDERKREARRIAGFTSIAATALITAGIEALKRAFGGHP